MGFACCATELHNKALAIIYSSALIASIAFITFSATPSPANTIVKDRNNCYHINTLCEELDAVFQHYDPIERIRYGYGMTRNNATALYWYKKSAETGDSRAMHNTGIMLLRGMGTAANIEKGVNWLKKAFENGQISSAIALGHMSRTGIGLSKNSIIAAEYYQYAADAGDVRAQHSLANLHMVGKGVSRSTVDAYVLYTLAARKGHLPSIQARDKLKELLSAQQLHDADWLVKNLIRQAGQ